MIVKQQLEMVRQHCLDCCTYILSEFIWPGIMSIQLGRDDF